MAAKKTAGQKALKISAKARYGLRILLDIALHEDDPAPRTTAAIAESQQLSLKFISRLVIPLRQAGMIRSIRGVSGGFRLARPPAEISLLDIVETLQGPVEILDCLGEASPCPRAQGCVSRSVWNDVNTAFSNALSALTLEQVLARTREHAANGLDYCI